ncbi:hypothetical protein BU17DRAFT_90705 [Hysterangium stoloniferum]|nr:hypothetical protein BU17DRAFT_90705 [Hysterangium stoloniferum]
MDFLRTDIALDEPPDEYHHAIKHKAVIEITYDDAELVVFVETALSAGYTENLKDVRLGSDLWALNIPHPEEVLDISVDGGRYVRIKAMVTFEGTPDVMTLMQCSEKSRQLKIINMAVLNIEDITDASIKFPTDLEGVQTEGDSRTSAVSRACTQEVRLTVPQTPPGPATLVGHATPPTALSTMSWTQPIEPPTSPSPAQMAVMPPTPTISSCTPTPEPSSPGSECSLEPTVQVERPESPDLESQLREEFRVILHERMFELQTTINEKDEQLRKCKEVVGAEFEKILQMRMVEVQRACNDEVAEMMHKVRHARAWAKQERKRRVEAEAHSWKASIPKEMHDIPVDGPGGLRDQLFAAKLEIELQKKRNQELQEQLKQSQNKIARLASEPGGGIGDTVSSGDTTCDVSPIDLNDTRNEGIETVGYDGIEQENIATSGQKEPEQISCRRCTIRTQSAKLSNMLIKTAELRVSFFERKVIESQSLATNMLLALQGERRMRAHSEAQRSEELRKRLIAEDIAEAVVRESEWPFVVPSLLEAFVRFYGGLEEFGKDFNDNSKEICGGSNVSDVDYQAEGSDSDYE